MSMQACNTLRTVADNAKAAFIDRDDAIELLASCILSANHALLLGEPGTGKSALVRYFAQSLGLAYWEALLNPDLLRDEIYGPIDPKKLDQGVFTRKWQGLATCNIAFGDEVGKASGQVMNLFLKAMQEREVSSGDDVVKLPLVSFIGASNEFFDNDSPALWDRFLGRIIVRPTKTAQTFQAMLTSKVDPLPCPLALPELLAANSVAKQMAANPSQEVITTITELWQTLPTITQHKVSDRRWRTTLSLAAGRALLDGDTIIQPHHLSIAKYTLWSDPDQISAINDWIDTTTNKAARELNDAKKQLVVIKQDFISMNGSADLTALAKINMSLDKLIKATKQKQGSEWAALRADIQKLKQEVVS